MLYFTQSAPYFSLPAFFIIFSSLQMVKVLGLRGEREKSAGDPKTGAAPVVPLQSIAGF